MFLSIVLMPFYSQAQSNTKIYKQDTDKSIKFLFAKSPNKNSGTNIEQNKNAHLNLKIEEDNQKSNRIDKLWMSSEDVFKVKLELQDKDTEIKLSIFNILGKEVFEIYNGKPLNSNEYEFLSSNLPNGIYLCILTGRNFRDAAKFIVSR